MSRLCFGQENYYSLRFRGPAGGFCQVLPTTNFAVNLKATVIVDGRIAVIFFSDKLYDLSQISRIQFDGTFYTVPKQFYQLCTIFQSIGRHAIPAIHCLLTNKDEELYRAVLEKIREIIPQLEPGVVKSDWEQEARNAFKQVYPGIRLNECWFHYTQAIWRKTQKCGLASTIEEIPNWAHS